TLNSGFDFAGNITSVFSLNIDDAMVSLFDDGFARNAQKLTAFDRNFHHIIDAAFDTLAGKGRFDDCFSVLRSYARNASLVHRGFGFRRKTANPLPNCNETSFWIGDRRSNEFMGLVDRPSGSDDLLQRTLRNRAQRQGKIRRLPAVDLRTTRFEAH